MSTDGNNTLFLDPSNPAIVGLGLGNDRYVLSGTNLAANQSITISDADGTNTLQLVGGLSIASSLVSNNAIQLTLSNGAKVTVLGASTFTFLTGGDAFTGTGGVSQTFNQFVTVALGSTVPAAGAAAVPVGPVTLVNPSAVVSPTFSVTSSAAAVAEGASATFTVTLNAAQTTASTVTYTLAGTGGATLGTDTGTNVPAGNTGTLTFAAGEVTKTVVVPITRDAISPEAGEGVSLTLSAPSAGTVLSTSAAAATVAITDVPVTYTLTASAASVYEGAPIVYTLTASAASTTDTSVAFSVTPGDAAAANQGTSNTNLNDFAAGAFNPATVVLAAGATTATYTVTSATDAITELPENYSVKAVIGTTTVATATTSLLDGLGTNTDTSIFTLTTGTDIINGTAGNDTVNASVVFDVTELVTTASTFTVADQITGGSGTDTLKLTVSGAQNDPVTIPAATITGVENIDIRNTVAVVASINASNFAGVTGVNSDRSIGDVAVTALATGASAGMIGDGTVANGTLSYAYATATADQVINIAGGTVNSATANITATSSVGATKATINSTGAANSVDAISMVSGGGNSLTSLAVNAATNLTATLTANDFAATAALTVGGAAASVNLGANFDGRTIDASGMTAGGLTIATNTNLTSFKGGQGNDTVTTTALAAAAVAGAVDAGAGTADVLNVATSTDVDTAAEAALFTNFEVLRNSGATDLDVSLISGITSVQLNSADAGATKLTAAQAASIKVLASNATNTIGLTTATGTADVLGLTLENLTAAAVATVIDVTALTATGFETLNVVSSSGTKAGGTGTGNDLAFAAAGDLTTISVSGAYDLTIAAASITKAVNITSTQTGTAALYVSGNLANGSSVTGSVGADAFILGTGFGTYNGGAGNDTLSGTVAQLNTGADYNVVNGGEGTDTLNITNGAASAVTIVDNNLSKVSGFEKIVITSTTTAAQSIQTGGFFDAAFKASGVDLTTTSSTGNITIDMTSFTGAATLSVTTVGTAGGEGAISVQTGSGADTITVSAAAAGDAGVVKTFAGNDKITTSGTEAFAITAGAGNDTIILNSTGVNTLVFEDTAALNGADTITSFDKAADIINWVKGDSEVAVTGALTTTANAFYQLGGLAAGKADTATDVAAAVTAGATWTAAAVTAWIAVSDDNSTAIYQWTDVAGTAGVQVGEITLVGTIDAAMTSAELATAITIA